MAPPPVAIKKENAAAIASNDFFIVTSIDGGGQVRDCKRADHLSRVLGPHSRFNRPDLGRIWYNYAAITLSPAPESGSLVSSPRDTVQLKLAILTVLAARPNGRATLAGMRYEVEALTADADQRADISSPLDDIDIFQSGLVITQGDCLLITEAGRAALEAIEGPSEASRNPPPPSSPHSMRMIDDLIGTEERQKIFDLELRGGQVDPDPEGVEA